MIWLIVQRGRSKWAYTPADAPCWKGQIVVSFHWFWLCVGWHRGKEPGPEGHEVGCERCGAPYGKDGWCDVVIPDEIWNWIMPAGGLLCFRCMTKELVRRGMSNVPVIVVSGPYSDANETWRLIGLEHGRKLGIEELLSRIARRDGVDIEKVRGKFFATKTRRRGA